MVGAADAVVVEHAVDECHHRQEAGDVLGVVVLGERGGEIVGRDVVEGVGIEVAVEMEHEVIRGDQRGAVGVGERVRVAGGGHVTHRCGGRRPPAPGYPANNIADTVRESDQRGRRRGGIRVSPTLHLSDPSSDARSGIRRYLPSSARSW